MKSYFFLLTLLIASSVRAKYSSEEESMEDESSEKSRERGSASSSSNEEYKDYKGVKAFYESIPQIGQVYVPYNFNDNVPEPEVEDDPDTMWQNVGLYPYMDSPAYISARNSYNDEPEVFYGSNENRDSRLLNFLNPGIDHYNPEYVINPSIAQERRDYRLRFRRGYRPYRHNPYYDKWVLRQAFRGTWSGNPREYGNYGGGGKGWWEN